MKAKVFKYKSDGNTVVAPYMELEPYAENVYLSLSRKNEYGNCLLYTSTSPRDS